MMKHVFLNKKPHKPMEMANYGKTRLPVDRKLVHSIVRGQSHDIYIRTNKVNTQPTTYAEVYHPATINGDVVYVLRLLVNLEKKALRYTQLMYSGAAIVLLLLALAFGYPARKYLLSSKKQRQSDEHARYLAEFDSLTGIANRNAFQEIVPGKLNACASNSRSSLLFLVDIDNFKEINDFHGHHIGDRVLLEVDSTLKKCAGPDSFVARIGGDEFAIAMCGENHTDSTVEAILNVPRTLELRIEESEQKLVVSFCVGLARFPRDGENLKVLMQHADLALYAAKSSDGRGFREYEPGLGKTFKERVKLFKDFRQALRSSQIVPF